MILGPHILSKVPPPFLATALVVMVMRISLAMVWIHQVKYSAAMCIIHNILALISYFQLCPISRRNQFKSEISDVYLSSIHLICLYQGKQDGSIDSGGNDAKKNLKVSPFFCTLWWRTQLIEEEMIWMTLREAVGACMSPVDASAAISMSTGLLNKTNRMTEKFKMHLTTILW